MTIIFQSPRWYAGAERGDTQTTPSGLIWRVTRVSPGGREITFAAGQGKSLRVARVVVAVGHPEYPSDAVVEAAEASERRAARAVASLPWLQ